MQLLAGYVWMHPPQDLEPVQVRETEVTLLQPRGWMLCGPPPAQVSAEIFSALLPCASSIGYPCGCKLSGPGDLPAYCPTHGIPPPVSDFPAPAPPEATQPPQQAVGLSRTRPTKGDK